MQVQMIDPSARTFTIDSTNPETIILWMAEYIPHITPDWRMRVWLATELEARMFGGQPYAIDEEATEAGYNKIANFFRRAKRDRKKVTA